MTNSSHLVPDTRFGPDGISHPALDEAVDAARRQGWIEGHAAALRGEPPLGEDHVPVWDSDNGKWALRPVSQIVNQADKAQAPYQAAADAHGCQGKYFNETIARDAQHWNTG